MGASREHIALSILSDYPASWLAGWLAGTKRDGGLSLLSRVPSEREREKGVVGRKEGQSERESVAEFKARQLVSQLLLPPLLQPSLANKETTAEGVPDAG